MYKNQLQELAQRSCFNLPSYTCIREGPDHAPRFKASVNFNGEIFEGPCNCTTLRQAEHSAAEVALNTLSIRGPSRSLTAKVMDETGVYKNLLQETAHRAGLNLPAYTTMRSGPGHVPVFSSTVEVAGMHFKGEPAKTKKQAEKNAALAAWSTLKQMPNLSFSSSSLTNKETTDSNEEHDRVVVARVLSKYSPKGQTEQGKQRNQARKGTVSSVDSSKCRYGSSTENSMLYQQWRSIVMSTNFHPIQQHNRVFAPPLHPATEKPTEKPSLHAPNKQILVQVKTNLQVNKQEVPVPIQEHQEDEEEWLHGKPIEKDLLNQANSKPKPNYQMHPFPLLINKPIPDQRTTTTNQTHIRSIGYVPPCPSIGPSLTRCMAQTPFSYPRDINTFGFHRSHNMAPSVNIRSVVPVCAAPPPPRPTSLSSNASKTSRIPEVSSSPSVSATTTTTTVSTTVTTTQHTEQQVQEASRKLGNLQL
ncbi:hypothetical protein MKW94_009202 [Papaver nudicaule]|uniref:DRBM domain-containing protein n=1 Tax=Papaver nudicaule TaxID=74823 RepID=A0AA41VK00_PAPNU|nr:hypothetical protein [Papaver nudicaule]